MCLPESCADALDESDEPFPMTLDYDGPESVTLA